MVAADIDKDGAPDIVQIGANRTWVRTPINNGAGNFVDESEARMPVLKSPVSSEGLSLAVADLDNDRDLDVVIAGYKDDYWNNGASQSRELLNDGTGFFTDATSGNVPATGDNSFRGLAVADFNKDGKMDIFAAGSPQWAGYNYLRVLINRGDPFATGSVYFFDQTPAFFSGLVFDGMAATSARDLNNDGYPDLYMGRGWVSSYQNRVLLNQGGKSFVDATGTYLPSVSDDTRQVHISKPDNLPWEQDYSRNCAEADFDGDIDVFVPNSGLDVYYENTNN